MYYFDYKFQYYYNYMKFVDLMLLEYFQHINQLLTKHSQFVQFINVGLNNQNNSFVFMELMLDMLVFMELMLDNKNPIMDILVQSTMDNQQIMDIEVLQWIMDKEVLLWIMNMEVSTQLIMDIMVFIMLIMDMEGVVKLITDMDLFVEEVMDMKVIIFNFILVALRFLNLDKQVILNNNLQLVDKAYLINMVKFLMLQVVVKRNSKQQEVVIMNMEDKKIINLNMDWNFQYCINNLPTHYNYMFVINMDCYNLVMKFINFNNLFIIDIVYHFNMIVIYYNHILNKLLMIIIEVIEYCNHHHISISYHIFKELNYINDKYLIRLNELH